MRRLSSALGGVVATLFLFPDMMVCQAQPWEPVGPEGGPILALTQHPANPALLLAATLGDSNDVLFRSTDHGMTWSRWGTNRQHGFWPDFSPTDESVVYAHVVGPWWGGSELDVSSDGGQTWTTLKLPERFSLVSVVPDPSERTVLHVAGSLQGSGGGRPAYWKGTADGSSGSLQNLSSSQGRCAALQVEPGNPQNIYVVGYVQSGNQDVNKLWRSTDGGVNFSETAVGGARAVRLALDPARPGRIFVASDDYPSRVIYMSTDYGTSWTKSSTNFASGFTTLVVTGGTVYVSTSSSGVYKSTDGVNYTLLPGTGSWKKGWWTADLWSVQCEQDLCVEATAPHTLLVATTMGLHRSTNGGATWAPSNNGLHSGKITALRVAPGIPGVRLVAREQDAVYKAATSSLSPFQCERLPEFYACTNVSDLAILPADPNVIFALEGSG